MAQRRASGVGIRDRAPVLAGAEAIVRFGNPRRRGVGGPGMAAAASSAADAEASTADDWETLGGGAAVGAHDSASGEDDESFHITRLSPSRPRRGPGADADEEHDGAGESENEDAQSDLDASGVPFVVHTAAADERSELPEHTPTRVPMMAKLPRHGGRGSLIGVEGVAPLDFGDADDAPSPAGPPPPAEKENTPTPGHKLAARQPAGGTDDSGWTVCLADPTPSKALPARRQPAATSPRGAASPEFVINRPRAAAKSDVTEWLVHDDATTRAGLVPARVEADAEPRTPPVADGEASEEAAAFDAGMTCNAHAAAAEDGGADDFAAGPFGGPAGAANLKPATDFPPDSPIAKDPLARATFVAFDSPPPDVAPPTFEPAPVIPAEVLRERCHPALVVRQASEPATALALREGQRRPKVGPGKCRPPWVNPCDEDAEEASTRELVRRDADAPAVPDVCAADGTMPTQLTIRSSAQRPSPAVRGRRVDGFAERVSAEERQPTPPRPRLFDADPLPGQSPAASRAYTYDAVDQDPLGVEGLQSAADSAGRSDDFDADLRFMVAGASRFVAVQRAPGFAPTVTSDAAAAVAPSGGEANPLVAAGSLLKLFDTTAARAAFVAANTDAPPVPSSHHQASPSAIPPEEIVIDDETL